MKVLILFVVFLTAHVGAQDPALMIDCALVKCAEPVPPQCPTGTILITYDTPRPGNCCNPYECITDCTTVKCGRPFPLSCPEDSVLIEGSILPDQCCPQPNQCVCKLGGCLKKVCQRGYIRVLVSKGSGRPGECCDKYECKLDCTTVNCGRPFPLSCPEDSVLIKGITLLGQCCPQPNQCVCKPSGCLKKVCRRGYIRVLVSKGSGRPGECCDKYECKPDCTLVKCAKPVVPHCPEGTMLLEHDLPRPGNCCDPYECIHVDHFLQ